MVRLASVARPASLARCPCTRGALGEADGAVPDGTTVFDDEIPAVANLDPALLGALRQAATDAAGDGVEFFVDSGWRSPEYQEQLLREAVAEYGSEEEAARWVATPDTSAHVSGDAVDIGPSDATAWLSEHGAAVRAVPDLRQRTLALRTAPRSRSITAARPCTPTPRRTRGCSSDQHGRQRPLSTQITTCERNAMSRNYGRWPPLPWSP